MDKRATRRRLRLINRESLDRILRSEIYVNPSDGQLRAAHLILKYKPASTAFQAPQYVIKAKDPRIHRISVIFEGFIVPEGELIPEGEPFTEPLSEAILSTGASSSRSTPQKVGEEEEEEEEEGEEEAEEEDEGGEEEEEEEIPGGPAELPDSADELEVFDHPQSPEATSKKMVIQRRSQRSLKEAVQATFRLEEIAKSYYDQIDDEKKKRISAIRTLNASEQNIAQLKKKLAAEEEARKSADSALEGFQRQAEDQGRLLRDANAQLATSKEQVLTLQKQLEEVQRLRDQAEKAKAEAERGKDAAEQQGYNMGVADTEDNFRAEVPAVCREYSIRASTPSTAVGEVSVIVAEPSEKVQTQALPLLSQQEPLLALDKEKDPPSAKETTGFKDGAASQTFEQALASTTRPVEDAPMVQEKMLPKRDTSLSDEEWKKQPPKHATMVFPKSPYTEKGIHHNEIYLHHI
ncbi:uncharacterized protein LOC136069708 [Quercus suber]|uniref:uncharacterized protein LOC136069708 n=1 Tax=Quercus suber TaxID=58331 RepID=UPI0032DF4FAD